MKMYCLYDREEISYTQEDWLKHFEDNDENRLQPDFSNEPDLSEAQALMLFPTIQAFQMGERSDGVHLMKEVRKYANRTGDETYVECMKWFIREENWHSVYLKQYLNCYQVPDMEVSVLDQCFRELRRFGGLKGEVLVLATAEIVALSYYRALAACVESPALKQICRQMLLDELPHIVFQGQTLGRLGFGRCEELIAVGLMESVIAATWIPLRKVLLAGGYDLTSYAKECLGYLKQMMAIAQAKS